MAPQTSKLRMFNTSVNSEMAFDCPTTMSIQALTIHQLEIGYDEAKDEVTLKVNPETPAEPAEPVEEKAIVHFGPEQLGPQQCPTTFAIPAFRTDQVEVSYDHDTEEVIVTLSDTSAKQLYAESVSSAKVDKKADGSPLA